MAVQLFNLDNDNDKDIIDWLSGLTSGSKSSEIRAAIRLYIGKPKEPSPLDIINELRAIKTQLDQIKLGQGADAGSGDEPEKASKNLDDLLNRLEGGEFG